MTDHFRDATEMGPSPPSREALAVALAQAAESEPLLADRSVDPWNFPRQRIDLASGWQLWFLWSPDQQLATLSEARAPNGGRWTWGCDRWPDWDASAEAVALNPLEHLLTPGQRQRLQERLLNCNCWPEPDPPPPLPPINLQAYYEGECYPLS